ncbi:MAG: glycosyltransferase family 2 protein, partial [Anaerolineae bacterium]|nr:glycosyltransferase family 2 protein [Anaerolineae bacterium]
MSTRADLRQLVIMPAHNEAANISTVLHGLKARFPHMACVVIDDGSTDETAALARAAGVDVVSLPCNLGYGGAVQTGFRYAVRRGYDLAVLMDADGQHDPDSIPALLEPLLAGRADVVIGSRFLGQHTYPVDWTRRLTMRFFSGIVHMMTGQHITDPTSGFQALS